MLVRVCYKLSLFNAHATILIFHIFKNVNRLYLNQSERPLNTEKTFESLIQNNIARDLTVCSVAVPTMLCISLIIIIIIIIIIMYI